MALVHANPFSFFTAAQLARIYTTVDEAGTIALGAYGLNGGAGIRFSGSIPDGLYVAGLPVSGGTGIIEVDFRVSSAPASTNVILAFVHSGTIQTSLALTTSRTLAVYRGDTSGTLLDTLTSYTVPLDTTIHLSFKSVIHDSGSAEVRVYESADWTTAVATLTLSGDTQASASAAWDTLHIGAATAGTTDMSNLIAMDGSGSTLNDIIGPADVRALWASTRSTPSLNDFTLSAGSSVAALLDDTTPDDDTTSLSSSTANHQQSTYVDQVPFPDRDILGAELYLCVKTGSGSPTLQALAYQSATPYLGSTVSSGATYAYKRRPFSAMPDGTAFSTASAFDALQWGAKVISSGDSLRMTQVVVALIQERVTGSRRNLITGYHHTFSGDDLLVSGQSNSVVGVASQAHGVNVAVIADRSVGVGLDGAAHTLTDGGTFAIFGKLYVSGDVTMPGFSGGGSGVTDGDKGDITVSGSGATWTIDNGVVTEAKLSIADNTTANVSTSAHGFAPKAPNDTTKFLRGDGAWAVPPGGGGAVGTVVYARKTADESVTSSTTMQDDDHLSIALGAGEVWEVRYAFYYSAGTGGDFKWQLVGPSDLVGQNGALRLSNTVTSSEGNARGSAGVFTSGTSSVLSAGGTGGTAYVTGSALVITTTAGNLKVQWAQETSNGTATQVLTNSYLLALRLA